MDSTEQNADWFTGFKLLQMNTQGASATLRVGGTVGAPALVLLHGFPQTHVMWHRVAQALARDFFLVLPDLRGYGDSSHAPGHSDHRNYAKRAMAQDIARTLGQDAVGMNALPDGLPQLLRQ